MLILILMRKIIIAIHGLGNKPSKETLTLWWKEAIKEGLEKNNNISELPEFELIYWADILYEEPLDETIEDKDHPLFFREKYVRSTEKVFPKAGKARQKLRSIAVQAMNSIFLNDDYSLNFSGITDSLLKKYFSDLHVYYNTNCTTINGKTCRIKDIIRERTVKILKKYKGYQIFFIAHSMGSIIALDVLKFSMPKLKINTFATIGSPLGHPVIISNIAAENRVYSKKNITMSTPQGIRKHWYNFSDPLDKVAFDFRLSDNFTSNKKGIKPVDFIVSNDYQIDGERNPHKSYGYLRTAEFSEILLNFIAGKKTFSIKNLIDRFLIFIKKSEK